MALKGRGARLSVWNSSVLWRTWNKSAGQGPIMALASAIFGSKEKNVLKPFEVVPSPLTSGNWHIAS